MHRTAAVLAAFLAVAVAACGLAPDAPYTDVTFYWQFQDRAGNRFGDFTAVNPGCGISGAGGIANVDHVRVTMNGPAGPILLTVPCVAVNGMPGATFTAVPTGPYTWTLEGMRVGLPVFIAEGTGTLMNFPAIDVTMLAVYPNLDLHYDWPLGGSCAGVAEITFELDNLDAQIVEYSSRNAFVACGAPYGFTMPSIPVGNRYRFPFVRAVDRAGFVLSQACGGVGPLVQPSSGTSATAHLMQLCP